MKEKWNKVLLFCLFLLPVVAFLILLVSLLKMIDLYDFIISFILSLKPLLFGLLIALFLQPLISVFERYFTHKASVFLVYGLFILLIVVLCCTIFPLLVVQIVQIRDSMVYLYPKIEPFLQKIQIERLIDMERMGEFISAQTYQGVLTIKEWIKDMSVVFFSFVFAFFISIDVQKGINGFKKYVQNYERWFDYYYMMAFLVQKYVFGTILDLLFVFTTTLILLLVFRYPYAFFYAFFMAFMNLFPYIGAFVALIIVAFSGWLGQVEHFLFCMFLLWLLQQIEANFIQPLIFKKTMEVHPIYLFTAILIAPLFIGVFGIIVSPILAGLLQIVVRSYSHILNKHSVGGWEDIFW